MSRAVACARSGRPAWVRRWWSGRSGLPRGLLGCAASLRGLWSTAPAERMSTARCSSMFFGVVSGRRSGEKPSLGRLRRREPRAVFWHWCLRPLAHTRLIFIVAAQKSRLQLREGALRRLFHSTLRRCKLTIAAATACAKSQASADAVDARTPSARRSIPTHRRRCCAIRCPPRPAAPSAGPPRSRPGLPRLFGTCDWRL